jgi:predicted component of type VI protein secretion system
MVSRAKGMDGDQGIRYFIEEGVARDVTMEALGVTEEQLAAVEAAIAAEKAAKARVEKLLAEVEGQADEDRAKFLLQKEVSEADVTAYAGLPDVVVAAARKALAEEIAEQERKAAEAAAAAEAKRKAEAEGPALEDISPDDMVEHIEAIEEIMEFSEEEAEIRTMCEQSNIPKALVDIAVTDPDRLEKLKEEAEG